MTSRERLLRRSVAAAAVLALAWYTAPRLGAVYVGGWSMAPSLCPGDLVVYRTAGPANEGDTVLAAVPGEPRFLHRVVAVQLDGALRTKGDANEHADPGAVAPAHVAGVAAAVLPTGRVMHAVVSALRWCYNHVPIANTRR